MGVEVKVLFSTDFYIFFCIAANSCTDDYWYLTQISQTEPSYIEELCIHVVLAYFIFFFRFQLLLSL